MEWNVLTQNGIVIGVFESIQECLSWNPPYSLEGTVILYRVRKITSGQFKIQEVKISADSFIR